MLNKIIKIALATTVCLPASIAYAETTTINLMGYAGVFEDLYRKAVISPFEEAHPDIRVNFVPIVFSGQMLGQIRAQASAPQIDAVIMDLGVAKTATDENLFAKLNADRVPNIEDLQELAVHPEVAGVGVTFDSVVLVYNTAMVASDPESWFVLGDEAYAGKVNIDAAPKLQGTSLTFILAAAEGSNDPVTDFSPGIEALKKIAPSVQTWDAKPEPYIPVMNGQAALSIGYNARAQYFANQSKGKMKVTTPKEGTVLQINTINLVEKAPNQQAALEFINYALSPEAQQAFAEIMFYAPTNKKTTITADVMERTVSGQMDKVIPIDWVAYAKERDRMDNAWRREIIPISR